MTDQKFDILDDLPTFTASADFEAKLMGQIEMPDESNVVRPFKWLAPLAMAASLACGVFLGNTLGLTDFGFSEDNLSVATELASIADPYSTTFANF